MTDQKTTCRPDRVHKFLENTLTPAESSDFELHLTHCDSCQNVLANEAADDQWWKEARESLTDSEAPIDLAETLSFLNPSDNPRMMGRFGGYEIAGLIGQGGMGIVLKGFDESLNRYQAIKVLAPQLATRGPARNRFAREAQAAAAVVHDNVISIHGVSEAAGLPYLVMPYVRGESLQKRVDRDGPMSPTEVVRIAHQIASGLAAAHKQGLVHRDIKPANILLPEGVQRVLITDFGLARAVDDSNLTGTGNISGTPQFMSPEQARGETVDPRSDLFSLGTVMYSMCTGRNPFRASNPFSVLRRIIEDEPRSIRELNPEIPDWLEGLVEKLHAKLPEDRFQSAGELGEMLEGCLAHLQNPSVKLPEQAKILTRPKKQTWVGWTIPALVAIAGLVFLAMNPNWLGFGIDSPNENLALIALQDRDKDSKKQEQDPTIAEDTNVEPESAVAADEPAEVPQNHRRLYGQWELKSAVREGIRKRKGERFTSDKLKEVLGGLERIMIHDRHVYLIRNLEGENQRAPSIKWTDWTFDSESEPMTMAFTDPRGQWRVEAIAETDLSESLPTQLTLTIENEIRCVFRRWEYDSRLLKSELHRISEKAMEAKLKGETKSELDYYQNVIGEITVQHRTALELETIQQSTVTTDNKDWPSHLENFLVTMERSQQRLQDHDDNYELQLISIRLKKVQEEGDFIKALAIERELLQRLKSRDTDLARLNELRQVMISNRLEGAHQSADQVAKQMNELENTISKRYAKLYQIQQMQQRIRVEVEPLLKAASHASENGDHELGQQKNEIAQLLIRQLESEFFEKQDSDGNWPMDSEGQSRFERTKEILDARIAYLEVLGKFNLAKAALKHTEELHKKGYVTREQLEGHANEIKIAELKLEKAKNKLRRLVPEEFNDQSELEKPSESGPQPVFGIELFQGRNDEDTMERIKMALEAFEPRLEAVEKAEGAGHPDAVKLAAQIDRWKELFEQLENRKRQPIETDE
jgi:serine/threonine-protein kinase